MFSVGLRQFVGCNPNHAFSCLPVALSQRTCKKCLTINMKQRSQMAKYLGSPQSAWCCDSRNTSLYFSKPKGNLVPAFSPENFRLLESDTVDFLCFSNFASDSLNNHITSSLHIQTVYFHSVVFYLVYHVFSLRRGTCHRFNHSTDDLRSKPLFHHRRMRRCRLSPRRPKNRSSMHRVRLLTFTLNPKL